MGRILAGLLALTIALALVATLSHSNVLGWTSFVLFIVAVIVYVRWRMARRRPMW